MRCDVIRRFGRTSWKEREIWVLLEFEKCLGERSRWLGEGDHKSVNWKLNSIGVKRCLRLSNLNSAAHQQVN